MTMQAVETVWILQTAFTLWGLPVIWLEVIAFVLALVNILCNVFEIHWGFFFAIVSSALYAWFFAHSGIFGEAGVNVFFAVVAFWGWWQWLRGKRVYDAGPLKVAALPGSARWIIAAAWGALWVVCAQLLQHIASSAVPWWDGFVTAGSIVGAILVGRKFIENWPVWVVVNTASIGLFWYKNLVLTTGLYVIFLALAFAGWAKWAQRLGQLRMQRAQQELMQPGRNDGRA